MGNVYPPKWLDKFKFLRHSLKKADSIEAFDLLMILLEKKKSSFGLWSTIGLLEGLATILKYFAGFNNRTGRRWTEIHSSEVVESLAREILSSKRKTLE